MEDKSTVEIKEELKMEETKEEAPKPKRKYTRRKKTSAKRETSTENKSKPKRKYVRKKKVEAAVVEEAKPEIHQELKDNAAIIKEAFNQIKEKVDATLSRKIEEIPPAVKLEEDKPPVLTPEQRAEQKVKRLGKFIKRYKTGLHEKK